MPPTSQYVIAKRSKLRRLRGESAYADATPARTHIQTLTGAGGEGLARILSVRPGLLATVTADEGAEPFVPRVGTVRRLQALLYMGWGHAQLHERCGLRTASVVHQEGRWVARSTHDVVAAMYRDLCHTRGPSTKATFYAKKLGYAGPMDWHDIDRDEAPITDPEAAEAAAVDLVAVARRLDGDKSVNLTRAEVVEAVRQWGESGQSLNELERRTGINAYRVLRNEVA